MLKFDDKGLIPVIVQDAADGTVLMLGYASAESLKLTLERGEMVFFSRSRQVLWHKGETSGNVLKVKSIAKDCDNDTLLVKAEPAGPTCHTGNRSCFFTDFNKEDLA
jgi:phosphoribosyl-AMP cyclohydrolase